MSAEKAPDAGFRSAGGRRASGTGVPVTRLVIVADDLTGALDAGAGFAMRGARVRVARSLADLPEALASGAEVIALSTGTRDLGVAEAQARLAEVRALLGAQPLLFKKIDSRLKGPIAAELAALLEGDPRPILATPAIPALGRFCEAGAVTGAGLDRPIAVAPALGRPARVIDARTDAEIEAALPDDLATQVFVGAAGLAAALARRLWPDAPSTRTHLLSTPALFAIGSRDPVTLAQIAAPHALPIHEAPNGAVPALPAADALLVRMTPAEPACPAAVAGDTFARGIAASMTARPVATLFACGGESANAILAELGIGQLDLLGELLPGIPVSEAHHAGRRLRIVTKSGGFGPPDTVVKLVKFLERV
ncbi:four-carbon acid sugar kinase family protein [Cereibacter sphaeroides]|uniref:four-carbon acid sugar kinase family protein n=1 Tax=Cereibacter sphaeroides TaxID=1063 RepID=UPI00005C8136|nr:four-carbon acid sugar kinase family protein [Cereibacter sphaeroides]